jgi:putative transposase
MQNGYTESFNGRFRDECLNEHWFQTLRNARKEIAAWRFDYNEVRLHGSTRARATRAYRRHAGDAAQQLKPTNNEIQRPSTKTPAETLVWCKGAGHSTVK